VSRLPVLSGREAARAFQRLGWEVARQRGSHIILVKAGHIATLSVPDHREVAQGTLRALLRRAGVAAEDFRRAAD
jgi:predicted RNA binding protein YcfA (HicA-like mRNA interferase family)